MEEYQIKVAKCSLCDKTQEAVVFKKEVWVFKQQSVIAMAICQSCISKIFRGFRKDK